MAVAGIKRDLKGTFSQNEEGRIDAELPLVYAVNLDPGEGWIEAMDAVPLIGALATLDGRTYQLKSKNPRRLTDAYYEIDTVWSTRTRKNENDEKDNTNPESWAPKWLGSNPEILTRVARKDFDGNLIKLSNGQMYSDPVLGRISLLVTKYRKYCAITSADSTILAHNDRLNAATYRGTPKHTWLLSVSATPTVVNGYSVAELNYELRYNPLTWIEERLQHGSYYLDAANSGKKTMFRADDEGIPITGDLKEDGDKNTSTPVYRKYRVNGELNYGVLGF